ncbi:MAG: DHH family phosphoesterase [Candidatus Gottesmanbacteria bacterium]|nr:DHH family phosphoesterase [Candidatus Gottesmanbacteria bacterium]
MDYQTEITKVKDLLAKAKDILIVTHENPNDDSVGASLALYLGLVSLGKKVTVACPDAMTVGLSNYVGVNKVISDLSAKKNFIISLDYVDGSIEKVSYNIEGDKFNLVVEPRVGFETFSQEKVHYSYASGSADLIFAVNTIHLGGLKKLYEGNKDLFAGKQIINVDRHPNNAQYGAVNIVDVAASTTAEVVARVLSMLGVKLTVDIATNLLNAVYGGTVNFTSQNVSSGAFDVASVAIKAGGKRFGSSVPSGEERPFQEVVVPQGTETMTLQHSDDDGHNHPHPHPVVAEGLQQGVQSPSPTTQTPPDWLKPKIFKSSNLL